MVGKFKLVDYGERWKSCYDLIDVRIVMFFIVKGLFFDFFFYEEIKDYY